MSKISFEADSPSSKAIRWFLLLQIAAMVIVVGLSLMGLSFWALAISVLTLLAFLTLLLWLYARYRELPIVREKRDVEGLARRFQKIVQREGKTIEEAVKERELLTRSEKEEIQKALPAAQKLHIEKGLSAAQVSDATIPGLEMELRARLAAYGLVNAAQITERVAELPGIGRAEGQVLLGWRDAVREKLESTKPQTLPVEQLETIRQRYQPLQDRNDATQRQALASKQILEHELISFRPRLELLASVTFLNHLSKSLASRGLVAALIALGLILAQVVSSVSATAASILAIIPTVTATPSSTLTSTPLPAPTRTLAPTLTSTGTPVQTATAAPSQTATATPLATVTPLAALRASSTSIIPISGVETSINCDPAYPGVCIPPPPPDLDCGQVPYKRFQVLPPDPHHFDRDADGIGCES